MKIVFTSETVRYRSTGVGSDRGVPNFEAAGVLTVEVTAEVGRGFGAGWRIVTLYAGSSGFSGCWMIGAETTSLSLGISENLQHKCLAQHRSIWRKGFLPSAEKVPEADYCVLGVFHQLMFCASADVLYIPYHL